MLRFDVRKIVLAGVTGTAAMTVLMLVAPMMGMPPMNVGRMLGSVMGGSVVLGWAAHFMIGTALAGIYAAAFVHRLPGPAAVRGMIFALFPWLLAQLAVMPMMGMGLFSGSAIMAGGSLMGHIVFGAVVGIVYGTGEEGARAVTPRENHA